MSLEAGSFLTVMEPNTGSQRCADQIANYLSKFTGFVRDGKYGPYVAHAKVNATLPKGMDPQSVTMELATAMIAEKGGGKAKPGGRSAKAPARGAAKAAPKATEAQGGGQTEGGFEDHGQDGVEGLRQGLINPVSICKDVPEIRAHPF